MSEEQIQEKKQMMSTPTAILIGGILVSLAILYTQGDIPFISKKNASNSASTASATPLQKIVELGSELGFDKTKFETCINKNDTSEIDKDMADAGTAAGKGVGTPAFFIGFVDGNGVKDALFIPGAFPTDMFSMILDSYLSGDISALSATLLDKMNEGAPEDKKAKSLDETGILSGKTVSFDDDAIKGSNDAKVAIVEFSDYECPFCQRHFKSTYPALKSSYIDSGKVKFVFRDYIAVPSHNPVATQAALAANCAKEQGGDEAYYKFHDAFFMRTKANGTGL